MKCNVCGGDIIGDGYTMVMHCENTTINTLTLEPDSSIVYCIPEGIPCDHVGCLNHLTHPCEGCGRIGGKYV